MTNPRIAAKIAATSDHARHGTCPRCDAPVLRARAGRIAALDVIADPTPIDPTAEILARLDGRLTWRLITTALGIQRIAWRSPTVPTTDPVIADHTCPPHFVQEALL
ncbi:hypothetical protein PUR59_23635 [Streptomyces sp. SP18ES09]|uniref:hypothetical protein n=1 Tax=Streptomyces sp. SP18ES09 TaxID=3002532 RepID=UPI002E75B887|nr:hypothetical protein [Streptomyces sp. SP18ES09]MEE1818000.1 hypothetical protein [Streptomyces sp. SP18ES09]